MTQLHLSAAFIDRLGWVLMHSVWQFTLIALAAMVAQRAMQRSSSAARYWALLLALGAIVAAPVATWLAIGHETRIAEVSAASTAAPARPKQVDVSGPGESKPDQQTPGAARFSFAAWSSSIEQGLRPWLNFLVVAWCVGVFVFATRPILSWRTVRRLRTVGVAAAPDALRQLLENTRRRLGLRQAVELLQSTLTRSAVVVGYFRPMILLPVYVVTGLPAPQVEAILAHELAHVRRHDYLVNLLQTLVETVFFYHPAMWWLSNQIRFERENCCDDVAVAVLGNRVEYSRALLALEERRGAETALAMGARGGSLVARVRRLLDRVPPERAFSGGSIVGLSLMAAATFAVGIWAANGLAASRANDAASPVVRADNVPDRALSRKTDQWVQLFNGNNLAGWFVEGGDSGAWQVEHGELVVDGRSLPTDVQGIHAATGPPRFNWLLTEKTYSEFLLRFEYRLSQRANSGFALWATPNEKVYREGPIHLEAKLLDDAGYPNIGWPTGTLFWNLDGGVHLLPPDRRAKLQPVGSWNQIEVEARAQSLRVSVNGLEVLSARPDKLADELGAFAGLKRSSGHLGFEKNVGVAHFRKIEIKEFKSTTFN
jgi:beta-lactamase regulating signal transducer with metallopeptidase domain